MHSSSGDIKYSCVQVHFLYRNLRKTQIHFISTLKNKTGPITINPVAGGW